MFESSQLALACLSEHLYSNLISIAKCVSILHFTISQHLNQLDWILFGDTADSHI